MSEAAAAAPADPGATIRSKSYRVLLVFASQVTAVLAASAAFAAIATIFGSPVIGAIILIEAAGLGGPMLPLVLLPGLMSAGIGSVIFIGMGHWTGLRSARCAPCQGSPRPPPWPC